MSIACERPCYHSLVPTKCGARRSVDSTTGEISIESWWVFGDGSTIFTACYEELLSALERLGFETWPAVCMVDIPFRALLKTNATCFSYIGSRVLIKQESVLVPMPTNKWR
jgi:hypothetical protein